MRLDIDSLRAPSLKTKRLIIGGVTGMCALYLAATFFWDATSTSPSADAADARSSRTRNPDTTGSLEAATEEGKLSFLPSGYQSRDSEADTESSAGPPDAPLTDSSRPEAPSSPNATDGSPAEEAEPDEPPQADPQLLEQHLGGMLPDYQGNRGQEPEPEPEAELPAEPEPPASSTDTSTSPDNASTRKTIPLTRQQEEAIKASEAFKDIVRRIGVRVGQHWTPPFEDHSSHGAVVKVLVNERGESIETLIARSSGNVPYEHSVIKAAEEASPFFEVTEADLATRTVLREFNLRFGSKDAIWSWEEQATTDEITEEFMEGLKTEIEALWDKPDSVAVENDTTVKVKLSVPFGDVIDVILLRPSGDERFDASILAAVGSAGPFRSLKSLPTQAQQKIRQFNLHFTPGGIK